MAAVVILPFDILTLTVLCQTEQPTAKLHHYDRYYRKLRITAYIPSTPTVNPNP